MKPNIFLIAHSSYENQLTAYWHYMLNAVPGIGQLFVDEMCRLSGLPGAKFIGAIDHPAGDRGNHPDLLLQTDAYQVLFEHKLDSPVGPRQLHRYLDLAERNGWKLALVSASRLDVDGDVCQSPSFICPKQPDHPSHFLWQDIQATVARSAQPLAVEFCEYLEALGLGKFSWAGLGNPFFNKDAEAALRGLYDAMRPVFDRPGVRYQVNPNSVIYQVRKPFPPVHLINVGPIESIAQAIPNIRGPVMGLWVWVRRAEGQTQRVLRTLNAAVPCSAVQIVSEDHANPMGVPYDPCVYCERSYYAPLDQILCGSLADSQQRLLAFARAVVDHLREETSATGSVPNNGLQPTADGGKGRPPRLKPRR